MSRELVVLQRETQRIRKTTRLGYRAREFYLGERMMQSQIREPRIQSTGRNLVDVYVVVDLLGCAVRGALGTLLIHHVMFACHMYVEPLHGWKSSVHLKPH